MFKSMEYEIINLSAPEPFRQSSTFYHFRLQPQPRQLYHRQYHQIQQQPYPPHQRQDQDWKSNRKWFELNPE